MTYKEIVKKTIGMRTGQIRPKRENCFWTDYDIKLLILQYKRGVGISEMAANFERTEWALCQKLDSLGLYEKAKIHRYRGGKESDPECKCGECDLNNTNECSHCYQSQDTK